MNFRYRIKRYRDEEGEYSEYEYGDKGIILKIIETHWIDNSPNDLEIISIINTTGQSLILEHNRKEVFEVYFLPLDTSLHFHKKSRSEIVYHCFDLFISNKLNELETVLNKTKNDNKFIRGNFFFIDHNYKLTTQRSNKELLWLLWALPIGLMLTSLGGLLFKLPIQFLLASLFLIALGIYYWLPGLLLHIQYRKDAQDKEVRITKGSKFILVKTPLGIKTLEKSQIITVTKVLSPIIPIRTPWCYYGYTEILFSGGEILNLTNLTVDQLFILDKFSLDNIKTKIINRRIPRLRNKSTVNSTAVNTK